ncbi:MAG TPA: hypothetical protein VIZ65_00775 [Cellvibrionaceae bacterium]
MMFFNDDFKITRPLTVLALLGSVVVALASSVQALSALMLFGPFLALVLMFTIWYLHGAKSGNLFIYISLVCILGLPFALKLTGIRLFGLWQIALVFGGLLGVPLFIRHVKDQPWLLASCILFGIYTCWAMLSSMLSGRFNFWAFSFQFISNLKPLLLISFSLFAWDRLSAQKILWSLVDNFIWILLAFIAFEWIFPGAYFSVFGAYSGLSNDSNGIFPSRAVGPFEHPSFLASVSSCFAMLTAARAICQPENRLKYSILAVVYTVCLLCSVQRQELVGAFAAIFAMLFLAKNIKWSAWHMFAVICSFIIVPCLVMLFGGDVYREAGTWGVGTISEISHPRAQQYSAAFSIANTYFPFGSGLGTFGGAGAVRFDLGLYYEMGFGNYWWFGKQDFLLDTYWPNSIAEGGWIGFTLLLLHYVVLGLYAIKNSRAASNSLSASYWLFAGLGVWFLIANAFSSPAFQDPRLYFWVAMAMALAHFTGQRTSHEQKT